MTAPGRGPRAVVVEDTGEYLALVQACLRRIGCSVAGTAESLADAVPVLRDADPDLVVLDHHLPDGLGAEFVPEVRRLAPRAVVVMFTSATVAPDAADAVVPKTAGIDALEGVVRAALANRDDGRPLAGG